MAIGDRFPQVLAAAGAGADWAWAELYGEYAPNLLRFIASQGAAEPEDCLGECFVQLVRNLPSFRGNEAAFRSWLYLLARNRVVDEWRAARRRPSTPAGDALSANPGRRDAEPVDAALTSRRAVEDILTTLGPDQRAVIVLRVLEEFSVEETAVVLRRSPGAVRVLQHRAIKQLRATLRSAAPSRADVGGRTAPARPRQVAPTGVMLSAGLAE